MRAGAEQARAGRETARRRPPSVPTASPAVRADVGDQLDLAGVQLALDRAVDRPEPLEHGAPTRRSARRDRVDEEQLLLDARARSRGWSRSGAHDRPSRGAYPIRTRSSRYPMGVLPRRRRAHRRAALRSSARVPRPQPRCRRALDRRSRAGVRAVSCSSRPLRDRGRSTLVSCSERGPAEPANAGDALTAVPLGVAFALRSQRAEGRRLFVVATILFSACVPPPSRQRLVHPEPRPPPRPRAPARSASPATRSPPVRLRAGRRLDSPALVADGDHARADAYVSLPSSPRRRSSPPG